VTQKRFKGFEIDEVSWELIEEGTDLAREWGTGQDLVGS
jgi:hypothetical protein